MKSESVLQCEQCENDVGSFVSTELDITNCRKIENSHGRLVCSSREASPPKYDDDDDDTGTPAIGDSKKDGNDDDENNNIDEYDHPDDGLPAGTYRKDCTGCQLKRDGELLACDSCKRSTGRSQYSVAYTSDCDYFINRNGVLRCKSHTT